MKKIFFVILFLMIAVSASAKDISVQWDINEDADYYVVYWGSSSGNYTEHSENITTTNYTIKDLGNGDIFTAVKAFNSCGNSSGYSAEVKESICNDVMKPTNYTVTVVVTVEVVQ